MKVSQQINNKKHMGNGADISTKKTSLGPYSNLKATLNKKKSNSPDYRARLFKYYEYVIDKSNNDEPFKDIKVISSSLQPQQISPTKKIAREQSINQTISHISNEEGIKAAKDKRKKRIGQKISMALNQEQKFSVKLPPINRRYEGEQSEKGEEWKKYYNQHNLQTVKIDELTISKIEENQKMSKIKHRVSMS